MGNPLFDRRSPTEWSATGQVIDFEMELRHFERLAGALNAELSTLEAADRPADWREASVTGQLAFAVKDAFPGTPTVSGRAEADVTMVCQRCLEPFRTQLSTVFRLLLVAAEEEVEEHNGYEAWELDEPALRPVDLIDELLVMAMPITARHDAQNCSAGELGEASSADTTKPFADLRAQMERDN